MLRRGADMVGEADAPNALLLFMGDVLARKHAARAERKRPKTPRSRGDARVGWTKGRRDDATGDESTREILRGRRARGCSTARRAARDFFALPMPSSTRLTRTTYY